MTDPVERTRAVLLVDEKARWLHGQHYDAMRANIVIPRDEWLDFMRLFRHYPTKGDLALSHDKCPELWGEPDADNP